MKVGTAASGLVLAFSLFLAIASCVTPAQASPNKGSPFAIDLRVDLPLTLATGITGSTMFALREQLVDKRCAPACDDSNINALDRLSIGTYRPLPATAGDVVVAINLALPFAFNFSYQLSQKRPWRHFFEDALLVSQSLAINMGIHQLVSLSTQRPRPFAFDPNLPPDLAKSADAHISFYSGHTANSFAAATSASYIFSKRYPKSAWRWPFALTSHGLAATVGYLRVASGHHYISDVLVGALVGSSIGLVVPVMHLRAGDVAKTKALGALKLLPLPMPAGAGLGLRWAN